MSTPTIRHMILNTFLWFPLLIIWTLMDCHKPSCQSNFAADNTINDENCPSVMKFSCNQIICYSCTKILNYKLYCLQCYAAESMVPSWYSYHMRKYTHGHMICRVPWENLPPLEYTCEKELGEKPDSIRLLNPDDHLTLVCRLYSKGLYKIDWR